ncbi:MAG: lysine--tRNA ligase [Chloroflexi bacterium]|nr:lysine--tRNA ligase [Chloroflexota bacterium]
MREYSEIEKFRLAKLERLRARGEEPYPPRLQRTHTTGEAVSAYKAALAASGASADPHDSQVRAIVCGRIRSIRTMGKSAFAHIEDGAGKLQLYFRADEVGVEALKNFQADHDLGDFIQAEGVMVQTKAGEITLRVASFRMLAKGISPLPAAKEEVVDGERKVYSAFDNPEARYRQRYADLAVNPEVRDIFHARAKVVAALRRFLDINGFLEVETPILQPLYGGAAARPFTTHHNQLHQDLYLRISFELYLKRLLVGGLERVYEIGRDFRNEGVSFKHNPEFTQLEFYMAYADYNDVMALTELMLSTVAEEVLGTRKVTYQGHEIDFTPPWPRVTIHDAVLERSGIDLTQFPAAEALAEAMIAKGHKPEPKSTRGKLIDSLIGHYVEPNLIQPTFLLDYPRDISPLAKSKPGDPTTVERFELYVAGFELCNAFTELNDPLDQEARFLEMSQDYAAGDEEQHPLDEDYLQAMRYGMPPNGGFGMGVDRLTMLLTDKATIREVLLFPHLRTKEE